MSICIKKIKPKIMFYLWLSLIFISLIFTIPFIQSLIADFIVQMTGSAHGYERWFRRVHEYAYRPLFICTVIPAIIFYFKSKFFADAKLNYNSIQQTSNYSKKAVFILIAVTALIILSLSTTSSFLYPFNFWNDSNIIYTVGKGMAKGIVPYKDIFERKGILLFFIHEIGYLLVPNTFYGIFILELLAAFFFLLLCYKTAKLFTSKSVIILIPVLAAFIYSAYNTKSGDSAEEFCLPLLMYPLYISLKNIQQEKLFSKGELFFSGICAGCIFWIKYTMVGFFFGWVIIPVIYLIKNKQFKLIFEYAALFLAGIILTTIPWAIYFSVNHAIKDWIGTYIFSLMEGSNNSKTTLFKILISYIRNIPSMIHYNLHLFIFSAFGLIYIIKTAKKDLVIHIILTFIFTYLFIFYKGMFQRYYCFILGIFSVFAIIPIHKLLISFYNQSSLKNLTSNIAFSIILVLSILYTITNYIYIGFMTTKKENYPQYRFAKIINGYENSTMMTYKFMDRGFYTYADKLPNFKYFFEMGSDTPEQKKYAEEWIAAGNVDFLITEDAAYDLEHYTLIAEDSITFEYGRYFEDTKYYLYKLNGLEK